MKLKLKLRVPAALDAWLWDHSRAYRRHQMRQRLVRHEVQVGPIYGLRCDLCGTLHDAVLLTNGSRICVDCSNAMSKALQEMEREQA